MDLENEVVFIIFDKTVDDVNIDTKIEVSFIGKIGDVYKDNVNVENEVNFDSVVELTLSF